MPQDKTELVHLQENLFQSRKEGLHENVATVVTQAEVWGNANERDLSQALQYKYDALKDRLLRDALVQQVGVTEWAALSEKDRFTKLAQMKLKVKELQREGSTHPCDLIDISYIIYLIHVRPSYLSFTMCFHIFTHFQKIKTELTAMQKWNSAA